MLISTQQNIGIAHIDCQDQDVYKRQALPCELRPNILSRWLNKYRERLKANGVSYTLGRTRDSRTIRLSCDGNDANDDISGSGAASKIPSPSSQPSQAAALPGVSRQRPGTGRCPPLP